MCRASKQAEGACDTDRWKRRCSTYHVGSGRLAKGASQNHRDRHQRRGRATKPRRFLKNEHRPSESTKAARTSAEPDTNRLAMAAKNQAVPMVGHRAPDGLLSLSHNFW